MDQLKTHSEKKRSVVKALAMCFSSTAFSNQIASTNVGKISIFDAYFSTCRIFLLAADMYILVKMQYRYV